MTWEEHVWGVSGGFVLGLPGSRAVLVVVSIDFCVERVVGGKRTGLITPTMPFTRHESVPVQ